MTSSEREREFERVVTWLRKRGIRVRYSLGLNPAAYAEANPASVSSGPAGGGLAPNRKLRELACELMDAGRDLDAATDAAGKRLRAIYDSVNRVADEIAASASAVPAGGGWRCPGCGIEYVSDVGTCGQLKPWDCAERVVSSATWRAARAVARAADADGCFEDLDAARAARDWSSDESYAEEVCSGAEDRAYFCKLASAALAAASPAPAGDGAHRVVAALDDWIDRKYLGADMDGEANDADRAHDAVLDDLRDTLREIEAVQPAPADGDGLAAARVALAAVLAELDRLPLSAVMIASRAAEVADALERAEDIVRPALAIGRRQSFRCPICGVRTDDPEHRPWACQQLAAARLSPDTDGGES